MSLDDEIEYGLFLKSNKLNPTRNSFDPRFTIYQKLEELNENEEVELTFEYINSFDKRFYMDDIVEFYSYGINNNVANKYPCNLKGDDIIKLYDLEITPEIINIFKDRESYKIIEDTILSLDYMPLDDLFENELETKLFTADTKLIGIGASGLIFSNKENNSAIKLSFDLEKEIELYNLIKKKESNIIQINKIIKLSHYWNNINAIELEYINGNSLEELCDHQKKTFDPKESIKYSYDVFSGLYELKNSNISHNDVWLGNIMLDYDKNRAVIIDLGLATEDNEKRKEGNRRYRGNNDLVSLGQVIYKMITGRHLFNPTINKSSCMISDLIRKERELSFSNPNVLEKRLKQVDENIKNKEVAEIIKICLTAKNKEDSYFPSEEVYQDLEQRFKAYVSR